MADKPTDTKLVVVMFTLDSSSDRPYIITECEGEITSVDGSTKAFPGWAMDVGTPIAKGADFILIVRDKKYDPDKNRTSVGNFAVTFIPHGSPNGVPGSPFGNANSIPGSAFTMDGNEFVLDLKGAKIQKRGTKYSWDWSLLVQITLADGKTTHDFVSDPQMDVDPLPLERADRERLVAVLETFKKRRARTAKSNGPTKKAGHRRR